MLHHISLPATDLDTSATLYDAALGALGYRVVSTGRGFRGYGLEDDKDIFALKSSTEAASGGPQFHLAFAAPSHTAVDAFHQAALAHGALDNGAPGFRSHYGPHYYAAFIIDPDGHRLEAVHNSAGTD